MLNLPEFDRRWRSNVVELEELVVPVESDALGEAPRELLDLPRDQALPRDAVVAHRTDYAGSRDLSPEGIAALQAWYADDYELLRIGDDMRAAMTVA